MASATLIPDQETFTTGQLAKLCSVAPRTVAKWIDNGLLNGYRIPGSQDRRVTREALLVFMEENKMSTSASAYHVILLSPDAELAKALTAIGVVFDALQSSFDLGEHLRANPPAAILIDFAIGADEAEQVLRRVAVRFPKVKRFAINDCGSPCESVRETFSRPFDTALVAERIASLLRPEMRPVDDPLYFDPKHSDAKNVFAGRAYPLQAPPVNVDPNDKTTLLGFFENVYRPHRLLGASTSTVTKHRTTICRLSEVIGRPALLEDLTDDNCAGLMQHIAAEGRKPGTINHARNCLLALANHAVRRGLLKQVFEVSPLKDYQRSPVAWTEEQLQKLMSAISGLHGNMGGIPAAQWWEVLHRVMWDSALRIGALMQTKWSDYDLERGVLRVRPETQKDKEEQQHFLKPATVASLKRIQQPARELVFPFPGHYTMLFYHYNRILKAAGLPHGRGSMFHRMRKSVASYYEREGGNATALLGHSSRKMTMRYIDPTISAPKPASAVLFELEPAADRCGCGSSLCEGTLELSKDGGAQ